MLFVKIGLLVAKLGPFEDRGWFPKLVSKFGFQNWLPNLASKMGIGIYFPWGLGIYFPIGDGEY